MKSPPAGRAGFMQEFTATIATGGASRRLRRRAASGRLCGRRRAAFGLQAAGDFLAIAVQLL
ncbi:TPA: hypothetical protein ACV4T7_006051, partial [Burkholderia ambifaria]